MSKNNLRPDFDDLIQQIVDYVVSYQPDSKLAWQTAHWCLFDTLGCGMLALNYPACTKLLGPIVDGITISHGVKVPGTSFELDPVQAAFNMGAMNRWLDFNDTWLAAEWGHPSDNLAAILAVCAFQNARGQAQYTMRDILAALIKAHEIQGILALENSFNRVGLDHVILVKIASAAVVTQLLGGDRDDIMNALSQVFVDGQSLRTYRHAPNTGTRKSWAAGDAAARAVQLALFTLNGEQGYPSAISAEGWGFSDVLFNQLPINIAQSFSCYVMENVLFKISFPAEFHAQTAVEAAIQLHPQILNRYDQIEIIKIRTQESALRIISKQGPLYNPADRDHCLEYMVAIGLLHGELRAEHYEDDIAADPRIDILRNKMRVSEAKEFSEDYLHADKRSIANAIEIVFQDGSNLDEVRIDYPVGHRIRREEGIPLLKQKLATNLATQFSASQVATIMGLAEDFDKVKSMRVEEFLALF